MRRLFVLLIFLLPLIPNVNAACSLPYPNIADCVADGVSSGITKAIENSADGLINTAANTSGTNITKSDPINSFIVNMLDPSFNPEHIPWVIHARDFTALIYVIIAIMYFTWGGAFAMLQNAVPTIGTEIDWVLGTNYKDFYFSQYAINGIKAFVFPVLGYFLLTYLLLISSAFTRLAVGDAVSTLIPNEMDTVVYFVMALVVFLLSVFMAIRYIVITIFSAYLLIILGAYLFDEIRPIASTLLKWLIMLIFMPFVLSLIASGGIAFIEGTPWLPISKPVEYIALAIIMLASAIILVFGWRLVWSAADKAAYLAMMAAGA